MDKQKFIDKYRKIKKRNQSDLLRKKDRYFWSYYAGMGDMSIADVSETDVAIVEELIEEGRLIRGTDWSWPLLINGEMRIITFERYEIKEIES